MFNNEIGRPTGFSPPLFLLQLVAAPLGGLIFGLLVAMLFEVILRVQNDYSVIYFAYGLVGFLLGYFVATALPRACESGGLWVWIPPCSLVT